MNRKPPATPEQLQHAAQLLADGASQKETHRTTGISRTTLRKYFPGQAWTSAQSGEYAALVRKDIP